MIWSLKCLQLHTNKPKPRSVSLIHVFWIGLESFYWVPSGGVGTGFGAGTKPFLIEIDFEAPEDIS